MVRSFRRLIASSNRPPVPVVSMETHGSACFYHSVLLNQSPSYALPEGAVGTFDPEYEVKVATLPRVTSRATSLGAITPAAGVVKMAVARPGPVHCVTISDELAMQVVGEFAGVYHIQICRLRRCGLNCYSR